jgi:hypothetical protein
LLTSPRIMTDPPQAEVVAKPGIRAADSAPSYH